MRLGLIFFWVLAAFSLLCFISPWLSPADFWPASFLSFGIPLAFFIQVPILLILAWRRAPLFFVSLALLLFGARFFPRMMSFDRQEAGRGSISVLSYNVRVLNVYPQFRNEGFQSSKDMIAFLDKHPADVLCLQEFYDEPKDRTFNAIMRLKKKRPYYHFVPFVENRVGAKFGMVIFSRYPILNRGQITFREETNNQVIFAHIATKQDTFAVYNVHLQSMNMKLEEAGELGYDESSKKLAMRVMLQFKNGSIRRAGQIERLSKSVALAPYPSIICGDFNETPFGYAYETMLGISNNAFEKKGTGTGFTYNGGLPFLRIDNQFFTKDLRIKRFETLQEIRFTDHFPLYGVYALN